MSEQKFEASARRFTRITRRGLIEENAVTKEIERISSQPEDMLLGKPGKRRQLRVRRPKAGAQPQKNTQHSALRFSKTNPRYRLKNIDKPKLNVESTKRQLRFERPEQAAALAGDAVAEHKTYQQKYRRMRLTQDALQRTRLRFEYAVDITAMSIRPTQQSKLKFEHSSDPKLKFNKHGAAGAGGAGTPPPTPPGGFGPTDARATKKFEKNFSRGRSALSKEVDEELDKLAQNSDNEGVQAANQHRKWVATGARAGSSAGKSWRQGEDKRIAKRAKSKQALLNREEIYRQKYGKPALSERGRNWLTQRKIQVRRFAEKRFGAKNAQRAEKLLSFAARKIMQVIRIVLISIGGPLAGIAAVYIGMAAIILLMFGALINNSIVVLSSYAATNVEIEAASAYYSKLEAELDKRIRDIPTDWEWLHIDEFRYDLDPIEHDPYQLMAYLSVKYPGFVFDDVKTELDYLYSKRYTLTLDEEIQIRYREETHTESWTDEDGNTHSDSYTVEVPYRYFILNVILDSRPQEPLLRSELRTESPEIEQWYDVLMETKGARQAYANPFDIDWSDNVSSLYGYRVDPIGGRELQRHRGLDIAAPGGTPIKAGLTGTVRHVGFDAIMGHYIILDADNGRSTVKYGHCSAVLVSAGEKVIAGETVVGAVGSTGQSTGPHLHVEILEDGEYVNPLYSLDFRVKTERM